MDIPLFNGYTHIEDFLDWISKVEYFFDYVDIQKSRKVKLVVLCFKGSASAWWNRAKYQKPIVRTWDKLKRLLQAKFLPHDYEGVLFTQYRQC